MRAATTPHTSVRAPIRYRDAASILAVFPARAGVAARLLPHPRFRLVRLAPGVTMVAVAVFAYRDCDIGPYNELAVSLPVTYGRWSLPLWPMLQQRRARTFSGYVLRLPVTTEIARAAGVKIYGYPKVVADIDFEIDDSRVTTRLAEGDRDILSLSGPVPGSLHAERRTYVTYSLLDNRPVRTEVDYRAEELAETLMPTGVDLWLADDHPLADELRRLLLTQRPLVYACTPRFSATLGPPEPLES